MLIIDLVLGAVTWYRSGPGGTELAVPKRYWWWSRTRHRVSCGTEMDRYRNGSPCGPEMVPNATYPNDTCPPSARTFR